MRHLERHRTARIGWLRAAVLGANDGIVSMASLIVGVAVASPDPSSLLLTGIAGLVAGAMSMAAGSRGRFMATQLRRLFWWLSGNWVSPTAGKSALNGSAKSRSHQSEN